MKNQEFGPTFEGRVVGIGASAGGLEALEGFFAGLGVCEQAAFVVIQHLSPDHKSMMEHLLARHTPMPVTVAEDGMALSGGHVYLLPPGSTMSTERGRLWLTPKRSKGLTLPIDMFFASLAQSTGAGCMGVILSGTGSDGSRGSVAINEAGGVLFAQDPTQAKFDGMPRSVMNTGVVDFVLPVSEIGPKLRALIAAPITQVPEALPATSHDEGSAIAAILALLHSVGGVDFRAYKPNTLLRRIERRMRVKHAGSYSEYVHLLEGDRDEVQTLQREILIPVTSFFRDPEHFESLSKHVVEPLLAENRDGRDIRVWVAACSTGEEAYSIAILFLEAFERARRWPALKIFATDIERQNIDNASSGQFGEGVASEVSPERLERFFTRRDGGYDIHKHVREKIIFARHNVMEDPPFTRIDLVTCRNMLIYVQPAAQVKIIRRFQYSLVAGGHLFLGSSESLGDVAGDFAPVNARHKIYSVVRRNESPLEFSTRAVTRESAGRLARAAGMAAPADTVDTLIGNAHEQLLQAYTPPSVLVSPQREVVHLVGDARRYLQLPVGQVSLDIAKLLPQRLSPIGVALLHKVSRDRQIIKSSPIPVELDTGVSVQVTLTVRPMPASPDSQPFMLMTFEGLPLSPADAQVSDLDLGRETQEHVRRLESELAATRESLQATIEELETSNEELQATNEELMSSNEELQSSNEELQSVNEELYTVNSEHQEKIDILYRLNADLDSMALAVSIATVFVDSAIRITRFTPQAKRFFRIQDTDIGRPLDHFVHNLTYPDFIAEVQGTLHSGLMAEREVRAGDGTTYLVRILPYTVRDTDPRGAVISVIDITSLHTSKRLQAVLDSLPEHIAELDADGRICLVNRAWRDFAEANHAGALTSTSLGVNYLQICRGSNDPDALRSYEGISKVLRREADSFQMVYPCHSPTEKRWFLMYAAPIHQVGGGVIVSHINISEWMRQGEVDDAPAQA